MIATRKASFLARFPLLYLGKRKPLGGLIFMKKCSICGNEFPATKEYFKAAKTCKNGISRTCKPCYNEATRKRNEANKEKVSQYRNQYREANREKVAEYSKRYREENKEKETECKKLYYKDNKEKIDDRNRRWQETNKVKISEYGKQYREANREKIVERERQWREAVKHTEKYKMNNAIKEQRRRSRKRELPATLTPEQWESIKKYFDYKCAYCGEDKPLAQEHFIPLSNGGEFAVSNIICACRSCNSSKGNKSFFGWYPKYKHYSKQREQKILKYLGYTNGVQQLSLL